VLTGPNTFFNAVLEARTKLLPKNASIGERSLMKVDYIKKAMTQNI
jgi:hypothetical protein